MKNSLRAFMVERYKINKTRNYPFFYIMIDLHGTIIPHSRSASGECLEFINEECKSALQILSSIPNIALIVWTSSSREKWDKELDPWFKSHNITFKYFNENPDCKSGEYSKFDDKFYFDVGIDDKFNFDPSTDWFDVFVFANALKEGFYDR